MDTSSKSIHALRLPRTINDRTPPNSSSSLHYCLQSLKTIPRSQFPCTSLSSSPCVHFPLSLLCLFVVPTSLLLTFVIPMSCLMFPSLSDILNSSLCITPMIESLQEHLKAQSGGSVVLHLLQSTSIPQQPLLIYHHSVIVFQTSIHLLSYYSSLTSPSPSSPPPSKLYSNSHEPSSHPLQPP